MKKYILFLPLFVFLCSCAKEEVKKTTFTPAEQGANLKSLYNLFKKEYAYADPAALFKLGTPLNIIRDTVKNIHETNLIDSVFTYTYKDLEIHFLKSNAYNRIFHTCTCIKRDLGTREFTLKINFSKEEVEAVFGKTEMLFTSPEAAILCYEFSEDENEEVANDQVTFVFTNNKLTEINYMPYVD